MLTFDPIKHEYKWDGVVVPSVTSILKDVGYIDFSGVPKATLEYARDRGSAAHEATRLHDLGQLEIVETLEVPVWRGYLDAYLKFKVDFGFVPLYIEVPLYSQRYGYAGTFDRVGIALEKLTLVELKATCAIPKWVGKQLAGYEELFNENFPKTKIKQKIVVQLKPDGSYSIGKKDYQDKTNTTAFLSALNVYNDKRR